MRGVLKNFKAFVFRGNVIDLASGIILGAAFTTLVNSFVKDFLTPLAGVIIQVPNFSNYSFTVRGSAFLYGDLLNAILSFVLVAVALYFFVVLPVNALMERTLGPERPAKKKCPQCRSDIPADAVRCAFCTSAL